MILYTVLVPVLDYTNSYKYTEIGLRVELKSELPRRNALPRSALVRAE